MDCCGGEVERAGDGGDEEDAAVDEVDDVNEVDEEFDEMDEERDKGEVTELARDRSSPFAVTIGDADTP